MSSSTYAVIWKEGNGAAHTGSVELGEIDAHLSARGVQPLAIALDELAGVRIARLTSAGKPCRPALVLERDGRPPVFVEAAAGFGVLHELADRLRPAVAHGG